MAWLKLAFMAYKNWIIAAVVALVLGLLWAYVAHAERAKEKLAVAQFQLVQAERAASLNSLAVTACMATNDANAAEALKQSERAREAEIRLAAASAGADKDVENINREAETFAGRNLACPAMDRAFRLWVSDRS